MTLTAEKVGGIPTQEILTDEDLANRWKLKKNTIHIRRMKGELPRHFFIGRFARYYLQDVLEYEQAHMAKGQ